LIDNVPIRINRDVPCIDLIAVSGLFESLICRIRGSHESTLKVLVGDLKRASDTFVIYIQELFGPTVDVLFGTAYLGNQPI
jgi:hypothetical protein